MNIPNYLTYFYRDDQNIFDVITNYNDTQAESILSNDTQWRGDGTYLKHRKKHEQLMRNKFIKRGGVPKREFPIYMILGDSPKSAHDLHNHYSNYLTISLKFFSKEMISFTYPDSLYKVPLNDLGKLNLERETDPHIYLIDELEYIINTYQVYLHNNHYIEAQIWDDKPLLKYKSSL